MKSVADLEIKMLIKPLKGTEKILCIMKKEKKLVSIDIQFFST